MAIAPWLTANNPLDFMRQGAALGLQLRAQDEAAERANAALALEQDKLNLTHQHFKATAAQAEARAAEALRAHNALENLRMQSEERRAAAQSVREDQAERRLQLMEAGLGLRQTPEQKEESERKKTMFSHDYGTWRSDYSAAQKAHSDAVKALETFNRNPMTIRREKAGDTTISATREKMTDAATAAADRLRELQEMAQKQGLLTAPKQTNTVDLTTPFTESLKNADKILGEPVSTNLFNLRSPGEVPSSGVGMTANPNQPTTVTTKEQFDALPSGAVYIGKDGRKYRKP